jgi:peptide/nickel transport system permease protein
MTTPFLVRRVWQAVPTVILVITTCFFLLRLAPGDLAEVVAGEAGAAPPGYVDELRTKFGLDKPLYAQYFHYAERLLVLDLGYSFRHGQPVSSLVIGRLPATLLLGITSLAIALIAGTFLGTVAALHRGRPLDRVITVASLVAYATPTFWVSLMLIVVFGVKLGWLPTSGMASLISNAGPIERVASVAQHLILPSISLSLFYLALYIRLSRAAVLEVLTQDYVRTALSKGISERRVLFRHVLPNALTSVLSMAGVQVGGLIGGAVFVETVFGWPGLGRLAFEAMLQRDFNLLMGILLFSSMLVVVTNIFVDVLYRMVDPRVSAV